MHDVPKSEETTRDGTESGSHRESVAGGHVERDPNWNDGTLDPKTVDAAKRVFERRRELLRRLA